MCHGHGGYGGGVYGRLVSGICDREVGESGDALLFPWLIFHRSSPLTNKVFSRMHSAFEIHVLQGVFTVNGFNHSNLQKPYLALLLLVLLAAGVAMGFDVGAAVDAALSLPAILLVELLVALRSLGGGWGCCWEGPATRDGGVATRKSVRRSFPPLVGDVSGLSLSTASTSGRGTPLRSMSEFPPSRSMRRLFRLWLNIPSSASDLRVVSFDVVVIAVAEWNCRGGVPPRESNRIVCAVLRVYVA